MKSAWKAMAKWYQKLIRRSRPPSAPSRLAIPAASVAAPPGRPARRSPLNALSCGRSRTARPRPANASGVVLMAR